VLQPLPESLHGVFDSISLMYILNCLPGTYPTKASHVAATLLPALAPGPDSTLYGVTILDRGVQKNLLGRYFAWLYNKKGMWFTRGDDAEGLKAGFSPYFEEVEVEIVGCTALFVCRGPKTQRLT
jgi:hypothetical protein